MPSCLVSFNETHWERLENSLECICLSGGVKSGVVFVSCLICPENTRLQRVLSLCSGPIKNNAQRQTLILKRKRMGWEKGSLLLEVVWGLPLWHELDLMWLQFLFTLDLSSKHTTDWWRDALTCHSSMNSLSCYDCCFEASLWSSKVQQSKGELSSVLGRATHDGFHLQMTLTDKQILSAHPCQQISHPIPPLRAALPLSHTKQMCDHDSQWHNSFLGSGVSMCMCIQGCNKLW